MQTPKNGKELKASSASEGKRWKKAKAGFWCPGDIEGQIKTLIAEGVYNDQSKAIVDLLRKALANKKALPGPIEEKVQAIAAVLERDPQIVIEQCVSGILEMIESEVQQSPLIVQEFELRKKRRSN